MHRHPSSDIVLSRKGVTTNQSDDSMDVADVAPPVSEARRRRHRSASLHEEEYAIIDEYAPPKDFQEKHNLANHIFGLQPWWKYVTKDDVDAQFEDSTPTSFYTVGNIIWSIFFGSWLCVLYLIFSLLLFCTYVGIPHGWLCFKLAGFFLWPFGKTLEKLPDYIYEDSSSPVLGPARGFSASGPVKQPQNYRQSHPAAELAGFVIYTVFCAPILYLVHYIVAGICWMSVFFIPMAKVNSAVAGHLFRTPLAIMVSGSPSVNVNVILYTLQSGSRRYFSYTVSGMSVWLLNLLPFIGLTLFLGYVVPYIPALSALDVPMLIFFTSLLSIIPIAFIMGMAISSVASQSTLAVGAVLNATFGTLVELILYLQLIAGEKPKIVRGGITGALLVCLVLMPGASMVAGGVKHKTLRINARSAGVTSVLLVISIIGAFCPTIYYEIYGSYDLECHTCLNLTANGLHCGGCQYKEKDMDIDPVYLDRARPLMYICAGIMPFAYFAALLFTLRTHSHIYDAPFEEDEDTEHKGGHDAPAWSTRKCILILFMCTGVFALVSESLVASMDPVLEAFGLDEVFVGLTIIAVVTNFAEFVNAVQFSMHNNMELALEISSAAAVQTTLIIMPVLVLASALINQFNYAHSFTLIFPALNLSAVFFGFLIYYINSISGTTNYFNGVAFIIIYFLLVVMFYYVPAEGDL